MNLYWVETLDHGEDWFVVGHSEEEAEYFHVSSEGYEVGDAKATFVTKVHEGTYAEVGWPTHETLEACGARVLRPDTPRVVEIGGRKFCEGLLEDEILRVTDDQFEALGQERVEIIRNGIHGITEHLKSRFKNIRRVGFSNPAGDAIHSMRSSASEIPATKAPSPVCLANLRQ